MLDLLKFDISASNAKAVGALRDTKRELGGIKGALVNVNDYARRAGKSMRNIGAGMTAAVSAPIALLGKQSVELYDIQKRAEDAVATVIASTDGAAGRSLGDLKALASQMQRVSNFGDENILQNVTAPLLTFTNIQDDVFDRAQANVLDMATLLKMDLKSASVLVGKALNDPIKGMSALSRSGVTFSASQEDVIKALVATGDVAGAQAVILEELERQFGGQAEAAAKAPLGAFRQLQNAIGDVKESLGEQIVPFLTPLVEKVQEAVSWFGQLSPEVKKNIVIFGGIAAVAGPVLAFLGLATLGVMALAGGFGLLASPIALVVLGFAALAAGATWVVTNWDALKERFPIFEQAASLAARLREAWSNLPAIKWLALIPALLWARFIPALVWSVYVKAIAWAALAGSLTWSSLVTALVWGARFIPVIGWAALAGTLIWSMIIKPLGWADFIAKIDWSQYVPEINWDNLIGGKSAGSKARKDGREVGTQLGAGLAEGVQAATPTGTSAGRKLIRDTVNATKSEAGVQSPSRVFRQIGDFLGQGLALGIRGSAPQAVGEMTRLGDDIASQQRRIAGSTAKMAKAISLLKKGTPVGVGVAAVLTPTMAGGVGDTQNVLGDTRTLEAYRDKLTSVTTEIGDVEARLAEARDRIAGGAYFANVWNGLYKEEAQLKTALEGLKIDVHTLEQEITAFGASGQQGVAEVSKAVGALPDKMQTAGVASDAALGAGLSGGLAASAAVGTAREVSGPFVGLVGEMEAVGQSVMAGLTKGIVDGTAQAAEAVAAASAKVTAAAKVALGVQSPSRVFRQIGDFLGQGLALGIRGSAPQAVGAMTDTANQIIAEGQKTTGFLGSFKGGVNTILTDVLSGAKTFGESLRGVINGAGNRLFSTGVSGLTDWVTGLFGFADGAAFSGGRVMAFADGGVVSGPVTFPMQGGSGLMGEAGPEAIMPLTRIGGKLGVRASGGGGAQMRDRVDVYLHPSAEFDARVETGAAQVYDAREAGTIGKAVGATYSAARERPLR